MTQSAEARRELSKITRQLKSKDLIFTDMTTFGFMVRKKIKYEIKLNKSHLEKLHDLAKMRVFVTSETVLKFEMDYFENGALPNMSHFGRRHTNVNSTRHFATRATHFSSRKCARSPKRHFSQEASLRHKSVTSPNIAIVWNSFIESYAFLAK